MVCAKTAETIEMQFGMLSRVGPCIRLGADAPTGRGTFELSGRLQSIANHSYFFWGGVGWVEGELYKTSGPILTIYTSYGVFPWKDLHLKCR